MRKATQQTPAISSRDIVFPRAKSQYGLPQIDSLEREKQNIDLGESSFLTYLLLSSPPESILVVQYFHSLLEGSNKKGLYCNHTYPHVLCKTPFLFVKQLGGRACGFEIGDQIFAITLFLETGKHHLGSLFRKWLFRKRNK